MLLNLAKQSLFNRKITALLTVLSIAVSVFVLVAVEHLRQSAKEGFTRTLSNTDLVVGARTGELNLLLYSVFRIGNATNNISWKSYQRLSQLPSVKWTIPISLGDSHKGYRVLGTTDAYFRHYQYGQQQHLAIAEGKAFSAVFDVVLGAAVAKNLGYTLGDEIILAHGVSNNTFTLHDDKPFTVVGILAPTGTPVDQTLHVSLAGIEAIHVGWKNGVPVQSISSEAVLKKDLTPHNITAFLVRLSSKSLTFNYQRMVNNYRKEPLMAILPGATLAKLWQLLGQIEILLVIISALVLLASLIGMSTMLLSSLRERQRELAILRAIGASPLFNVVLIEFEVFLLTLSGILLAIVALWVVIYGGQSYLLSEYGVFMSTQIINLRMILLLSLIVVLALLIGLLPAFIAYRQSLQQGLTVKT